jgi:hypothetical protein
MTEPERPVLRVIHGGDPSDEELGAIIAVLSIRGSAPSPGESPSLRQPLSPWVASGLVKGTRTKA